MITLEKPGSPEEVLEHHGVLGMKWGVNRARAGGHEIREARGRGATRKAKITEANRKAVYSNDPALREHVNGLIKAHRANPDRVIAARLTRGEKFATAVLFTPITAGAVISATSARSRRIERKQELGKYN